LALGLESPTLKHLSIEVGLKMPVLVLGSLTTRARSLVLEHGSIKIRLGEPNAYARVLGDLNMGIEVSSCSSNGLKLNCEGFEHKHWVLRLTFVGLGLGSARPRY